MKRLILPLLLLFASISWAQVGKFHSGFIYHFTKYIEWPDNMKTGDFVISIVGNNDVAPYLEELAKTKMVGTQKMVVKRCSSLTQAKGSHIIYLADDKLGEFKSALSQAKSDNSLLLTDEANYGKYGSMINFIEKDGKMQFEYNASSFNQTKLKISQQLVKLAIVL